MCINYDKVWESLMFNQLMQHLFEYFQFITFPFVNSIVQLITTVPATEPVHFPGKQQHRLCPLQQFSFELLAP